MIRDPGYQLDEANLAALSRRHGVNFLILDTATDTTWPFLTPFIPFPSNEVSRGSRISVSGCRQGDAVP